MRKYAPLGDITNLVAQRNNMATQRPLQIPAPRQTENQTTTLTTTTSPTLGNEHIAGLRDSFSLGQDPLGGSLPGQLSPNPNQDERSE